MTQSNDNKKPTAIEYLRNTDTNCSSSRAHDYKMLALAILELSDRLDELKEALTFLRGCKIIYPDYSVASRARELLDRGTFDVLSQNENIYAIWLQDMEAFLKQLAGKEGDLK